MKSKITKVLASSLCGTLGPDDGVDPRILFSRENRKKDTSRKDRQLCKEVYRAVCLATGNFERQSWVNGLVFHSVSPAPDASRLRVEVSFSGAVALDEVERVLGRLRKLVGELRQEIGAAINRKRVPELLFALAHEEVGNDE